MSARSRDLRRGHRVTSRSFGFFRSAERTRSSALFVGALFMGWCAFSEAFHVRPANLRQMEYGTGGWIPYSPITACFKTVHVPTRCQCVHDAVECGLRCCSRLKDKENLEVLRYLPISLDSVGAADAAVVRKHGSGQAGHTLCFSFVGNRCEQAQHDSVVTHCLPLPVQARSLFSWQPRQRGHRQVLFGRRRRKRDYRANSFCCQSRKIRKNLLNFGALGKTRKHRPQRHARPPEDRFAAATLHIPHDETGVVHHAIW